MDTSTLSVTDASGSDIASPSLTSALYPDRIQPGVEWFTRLISPLTRHTADPSSPPISAPMAANSMASIWEAAGMEEIKMVVVKQLGEYRQDQPMEQVPYPSQPQIPAPREPTSGPENQGSGMNNLLLIFIPMLAVILTVMLGLLVFLIVVLYMKRRRGIRLMEDGGPLDLSKGDGVIGEGGVEGVESRWLENVEPDVREAYRRTKDWQISHPPGSTPSEITLSQFLSIQEKGVSAWSFEPDYEDNLSLYVQSRTEITFLADGPGMAAREGGGNSVMANLPLPKLNEVYYWEVKMYDKPANTEVAVGLATRPYPSFRLPGWCRHSVAYFASDGFKSHNYPFTASSHGPPLNEGDVLGVGYRPRTGTVFFTRNGRKMDDAYAGLQRFNLFPTIGANGPCTIHVNLGQAGFVFIEANVKKWGLAPMTGTLAPPPAYGSDAGSILLDAGYGSPGAGHSGVSNMGAMIEEARRRISTGQTPTVAQLYALATPQGGYGRDIAPPSPPRNSPGRSGTPIARPANSSHRHRRAGKSINLGGSVPAVPSPLRTSESGPGPSTIGSRRRALGRVGSAEEGSDYRSPTDTPLIAPRVPSPGALNRYDHDHIGEDEDAEVLESPYQSESEEDDGPVPDSPMEHNPPTPNLADISLHSLRNTSGHDFGGRFGNRQRHNSMSDEEDSEEEERYLAAPPRGGGRGGGSGSGSGSGSGESDDTIRIGQSTTTAGVQRDSPPPPVYAPLDPHMYASLPANLPDELVNQAIAAMSEAPSQSSNTPRRDAAPPSPSPRGGSAASGMGWFRRAS